MDPLPHGQQPPSDPHDPGNWDGMLVQQCRLGLRSGAIDLVREKDVGEDGPLLKAKVLFPCVALMHDVATHDVSWHEVRGELDSREREVEYVRHGRDGSRSRR